MKRVGARYGFRSSASMVPLSTRRASTLAERELVADGREHIAPRQLEPTARRDVGNREQEMPHAGLEVPANSRDALLGRAGDVPLRRDDTVPLAERAGPVGVALGNEQRGDRALERPRIAAGLAARRVEVGASSREAIGPPPAHVDAVRRPRGKAMDPVALAADPDGRMRALHRSRVAHGAVDDVVPALKRRTRLGPHSADDLDAFRELVDALSDARERNAVGAVFLLEPSRAEAEIESPVADDVERGGHLGEDGGRSVRVAED